LKNERYRKSLHEDPDELLGYTFGQNRLKVITAPLKHSLETMSPLLDEHLAKEVEPTSYFFHLNKGARQ